MRLVLGVLIAIMLVASQVKAEVQALNITDLGTSARMIGLANIEGYDASSSAIFENPAGLYRIKNWSAAIFSTTILSQVDYTAFSLAYKTQYGTFGLGRMSASVDDIPHTSDNGSSFEADSFFDYNNSLYKLAYQYSLDRDFSIGVALNIYEVDADQFLEGSGTNMELGAIYNIRKIKVETSALVRNFITGSGISYSSSTSEYDTNESEELPQNLIIGGRYYGWKDWSVYAQFKHYSTRDQFFGSYALQYHPTYIPFLSLSLGNKSFAVSPIRVRSVTTAGIGLHFGPLNFYYAYEASENPEYENHNFFSLGVSF